MNYINTLHENELLTTIIVIAAVTGWLFKQSCYSFLSLVLFATTVKGQHLDST